MELHSFYRFCLITVLSLEYFPVSLNLQKLYLLLKRDQLIFLTNYRPISLLPSLCKVFERLICNRISAFFTRNNTIVPSQYGFRNNRSTIHAIFDVVTSCFDNISSKNFSSLLFLDIKKAFDSVSHKKLLQKLHHYGIRGVANLLLQSYLTDRKKYVLNAGNPSLEQIIE